MKDFELTLQIRNNRLKERRLERGLSAPQLADEIGVRYCTYIQLESMKLHPLCRKRPFQSGRVGWRTAALTIADYYMVPPEELWPDAVLAVSKSTVVAKVEGEKLLALTKLGAEPRELPPAQEAAVASKEEAELLRRDLKILTPREEQVLRLRFGLDGGDGMTLKEVGEALPGLGMRSVSSEQIRSIEARAMRKLREAAKRRSALQWVEDD